MIPPSPTRPGAHVPTRRIINFRPPEGGDAFRYSPQRDLAYVYPAMVHEIFSGLDEQNWAPWIRQLMTEHELSQEDLSEATARFIAAYRLFIRHQTRTLAEVFDRLSWEDTHPIARLVLLARIGEVMTGGWFMALRDVSNRAEPSAAHADFMELLAAGRAAVRRLSGGEPIERDVTVERMEANLEEYALLLQQSRQQTQQLTGQVANLKTQLRQERQPKSLRTLAKMAGETVKTWLPHSWRSHLERTNGRRAKADQGGDRGAETVAGAEAATDPRAAGELSGSGGPAVTAGDAAAGALPDSGG